MKTNNLLKNYLILASFCTSLVTSNALALEEKTTGPYVRFAASISIATNLAQDRNNSYDFKNKKPKNTGIFAVGRGCRLNQNLRAGSYCCARRATISGLQMQRMMALDIRSRKNSRAQPPCSSLIASDIYLPARELCRFDDCN